MWDVVVGGAVALVSALSAQLIQWHRDKRQWQREAARRFYEKRADVYQDFLKTLRSYAEAARDWDPSSRVVPPSELEPDVLDPVWDRLFLFKIYGTRDAHMLGKEAVESLRSLIQLDGDGFAEYQAAESRLIRTVRKDLDITDGDSPARSMLVPAKAVRGGHGQTTGPDR